MSQNQDDFKSDNLSNDKLLSHNGEQQQPTAPPEGTPINPKRLPFCLNQCLLSYTKCMELICMMKDYEFKVTELGKGCFGATYSVRPKQSLPQITGPVACKVFNFLRTPNMLNDQTNFDGYELDGLLCFNSNHETYLTEINMLRSVGRHQHIVQFFDTFQLYHDPNTNELFCIDGDEKWYGNKSTNICLDENLNNSGDFVHIRSPILLCSAYLMAQHEITLNRWMSFHSMNSINELTLQILFLQIGSAMEFLHERSFICHHDIKEDNIILHKNVPPSMDLLFVLIDFGLAARYDKASFETAQLHSEQVGSLYFQEYDKLNDESIFLDEKIALSLPKSLTFSSAAFLEDSNDFGKMLNRIFEGVQKSCLEKKQIIDKKLKNILNILSPKGSFKKSHITISWALKKYKEGNERM